MVNFFLSGSTTTVSDHARAGEEPVTFVHVEDQDGGSLMFIVKPTTAAEALAIADAFRAAALKHLPAQEEVPA